VHSARELRSSAFDIRVDGRAATLVELFEGFDERDRLGVVIRRAGGGLGASGVITAAVTAFYDLQRARGPDFFIYPDYYLFHVGRRFGDHSRLDIWPDHKEVVVGEGAEELLEAINDRGITRLLVEDGEPGEAEFEAEELASARARIATCLAYSATGRVTDADVRVGGNPVVEGYVNTTLDPDTRIADLRAKGADARADQIAAHAAEIPPVQRSRIMRTRAELVEDGAAVESYRRIELDEALALLGRLEPQAQRANAAPASS
jgi:hypothetical protein